MSDMEPVGQRPRASMPIWLRVVLFGSLAANLLVIGMVVGAIVTHGGRPEARHFEAARDIGPAPFIQAFDPETRRALALEIRRDAGRLRQNREELRQRFEALLAALRAEDFDRATVDGIIAEQRGLSVARQEIGQAILVDALQAMPREARAAYADRLDRSLRRDRP